MGEAGRLGTVFAVTAAAVVVLAGGAAGTFLYARDQLAAPASEHGAPVVITVRDGEDVGAVAADLESHGLVRSAFWFQQYARLKSLGDQLHAGRYRLDRGMGATAIIAKLEGSPDAAPQRALLSEGETLDQMAAAVAGAGVGISRGDYLAEARSGSFPDQFLTGRPLGASLEGFLFPDTYELHDGMRARDVVRLQLDTFSAKALPLLAGASPVQLYRLVTLASIVEREARFQSDRPLVAGVLVNRLVRGLPLQVDASVLYGVGASGRGPTAEELHRDTPYNTYLHADLPPTPISNPGLGAIQSAVRPATTPYLYYVSDGCGHNHYSVTAAEHQQLIRQYVGTPCPG